MPDARATVRVTRRCDNGCVFCSLPEDRGDLEPADVLAALTTLRERTDELTFVGGEPTLAPELMAFVAHAASLGFRGIGLQTNGRGLARPGFAAALGRAGLTDVHLSLHGAEAAVHDYHTSVPGSFARAIAGLGAARAAGLTVVVTTVLTRSNYRSLGALPHLLRSRGVSAWHVAVPWPVGRAADAHDRVVPRLALALPFALHAVQAAAKLGLPAYVSGAPLCLLGPFATRSLATSTNAERAYAEVCSGCAARPRCPGVHASYLARFAGDELSARGDSPALVDKPFARLFTGPAELAPPSERVMPEAPRVSRRRLPVLSRPAPGASEARTRAARSGEALREILPTLFETEGEA